MDRNVRSSVGCLMHNNGELKAWQIALHLASVVGLLLIGALTTLEFSPLERSVGVLVIGALLYSLAAIYTLTTTPQNAVLLVVCLSAAGIVVIPNFGGPLSLKMGWPVVCLSLAFASRLRERRARHQVPAVQFLLVFLGYSLASAVWFNSTDGIRERGLQIFTLVPLIMLLPRLDASKFRLFMLFVAGLACAEAVLAMLEVVGVTKPVWGLLGGPIPDWGIENNLMPSASTRGMGTTAHPIPLGMFCAFGALFLLVSRRLRSWLVILLLAILLGGIIASGTRSALIAFVVVLVGAFLTHQGRVDKAKLAWMSAICCILALTVNTAALLGASNLPGAVSFEHRAEALTVLPAIINQGPARLIFGTNPDTSHDLSSLDYLKSSRIDAIDNQWVTLLVQYGLVGFLLLLGVIVSMIQSRSWDRRVAAAAFVVSTWSFEVISWNIGVLILFVIAQQSFGGSDQEQCDPSSRASRCKTGRNERR
jgi:hypothetical protein